MKKRKEDLKELVLYTLFGNRRCEFFSVNSVLL